MEIIGKEFAIRCNEEELKIIIKAVDILKQDVLDKEGYSKEYLEKVLRLKEQFNKRFEE